jgi:hypothetical protein
MAQKKFLVDINLDLNQLVNARIENGTSFVSGGAGSTGRVVYDTSDQRIKYDTGTALLTVATLNDVAGLLDFKGGYDASTNTPNLETPSAGAVLKGDFYVVTTAGTFFGVDLEVGDSLFAESDNPSAVTDWVILQGNVVYASETVAGVIEIATQTETNAGTDDLKAITPLKLNSYVTTQGFTKKYSTQGNVGTTPLTVTHNLGTSAIQVAIYDNANSTEIEAQVVVNTVNSVVITGNNATAILCDINVIG